jgi:hypothetical protein
MKSTQKFEILSDATNAIIARYIERNFPGILIQGDTLKIMFDDIEEIREAAAAGDLEVVKDLTDSLQSKLQEILVHYEKVLKENGVELPYANSVLSSPKMPE